MFEDEDLIANYEIHNDFLIKESDINHLTSKHSKNLTIDAKRHLIEGFSRRFFMIQSSRIKTLTIATYKRTKCLGLHECHEINLYLNSYYVQLRGALDNLAWTLHYQFDIIPDCDEESGKYRNKCDLFGKEFLKVLTSKGDIFSKLATFIQGYNDWYKNLKDFRDPAAHRIPIYIPPSCITEEDVPKLNAMYEEYNHFWANADIRGVGTESFGNESFNKMDDIRNVGNFMPLFATSGPNGLTNFPLHETINRDQTNFLDISKYIIERL